MVDAVVLWVDGKDQLHAEKRRKYEINYEDEQMHPKAKDSTRFDDRNEIWYCLNSIRKFAPYIDRIFLITDNQRPQWLNAQKEKQFNIHVIDHQVLFRGYEQYLPTFNSLTLETMLHRIPGISDDFLCFCDDFVLINETSKADYFSHNRLKYRGEWLWKLKLKRMLLGPISHSKKSELKWIGHGFVGYRNDERYFGRNHNRLFRLVHAPIPLNKEILANVFTDRAMLEEQIKYKFKSRSQYSPLNLATNLALFNGKALKGPNDYGYLTCNGLNSLNARAYLDFLRQNSFVKSLCIQSLDMAKPEVDSLIRSFLEEEIIN